MTRSSPETELLPCPFCDGEPQQKHGYWIECKKCGAGVSAPKTNINTMGVIARWNTRAAPAGEPQGARERELLAATGQRVEVVVVPDEQFAEIIPVLEENAKLKKLLSDIGYVAEFGHPAVERKDDAAALEWIKQAVSPHSHGEPQTPLDRQKLIDLIGYRFGALVSGNNMPDMSGDPRARIGGTRRRRFDNACAECADAILALSRPPREYEPGMNPIDDAEFGMKP